MKKRIFCIIMMLMILLSACKSNKTEKNDESFMFYFLNDAASQKGTLYAQAVSLDIDTATVEEIVRNYLHYTPPQGTKSAFSASWNLGNVQQTDSTVTVEFSGAKVSAAECHLAAACMTKTLSQLPYVETVCLRVPGVSEMISLTMRDILLEDTAMMPQEETIALYLPDQSQRYLVKQLQTIEAMDTMEKARYILKAVLRSEDMLIEVSVESGLCKVNLTSDFASQMDKTFAAERLAVYSVVNSLTELPEITAVDIWIEGTPLERLNFMKLPAGLERDESVLLSIAQTDVDLYLSCDGESLVLVPYQLESYGEAELYPSLINALIEYESAYGVRNYIPKGTKLLNLRMEETSCIVDLSGEFLSECKSAKDEMIAVYSIVATLCASERIQSVEILVEGLEPAYRNAWLKNIRQMDTSWLAEE